VPFKDILRNGSVEELLVKRDYLDRCAVLTCLERESNGGVDENEGAWGVVEGRTKKKKENR